MNLTSDYNMIYRFIQFLNEFELIFYFFILKDDLSSIGHASK